MQYALGALVLRRNPQISISGEEFAAFREARATLKAAFALEEIYDLVLGNFHELSVAVLEEAVAEMTKWKQSYEDFSLARATLNRRTFNLLSAARLYLDQFPQWLKEAGADPAPARVRARELYDAHFEYRFMEALRNHVQHVGHAVHGVSYDSKWLPASKTERMQFVVSPYSARSTLTADKGFKAAVLAECPDKVHLVPAAHVYVESLSKVHEEVRKLADPLATKSRVLIQDAIARHARAAQEELPGLAALALDGARVIEEVPLLLDWDDVRVKLVSKNRRLSALGRSYISSRPDGA